MATIRISDLSLRAIIGTNDWEREKEQDILINVEIDFDASRAAQTDDIKDTVNYKEIKQNIIKLVEQSQFFLVEKLASEILNVVMQDSKVQKARVRIDKPQALRFAKSVSVELKQKREEK